MDVGGSGGGDLPGTYTINEGATRALGTNKRSASERCVLCGMTEPCEPGRGPWAGHDATVV